MLLFNLNSAAVTALAAIISIHLMLLFNGLFPGLPIHILLNFNTSNVTIQLIILLKDNYKRNHFNTSNVTIQQREDEVWVWYT